MGVLHASQTALIMCVIASGAFLGITNTLMTQVVMESAPVPRSIASSAYSFVRFCGGAIAPFVAGKLAEHVSTQAPFFVGAAMTAIGIGVTFFYRRSLVPAAHPAAVTFPAIGASSQTEAAGAAAHSAVAVAVAVAAVPETASADGELQTAVQRPGALVVAVAGDTARRTSAMAVPLARARGGDVHVLHVIEEDILAGEESIDLESEDAATELLAACVAELRESGMPVTGELLHSVGSHAGVADRIMERAAELGAGAIVVGPDTRHGVLAAPVAAAVAEHAEAHVIVPHPSAGALGRPVQPSVA